jgi:hypothetical protein
VTNRSGDQPGKPIGPVRAATRPLGYLGLAVVWLAVLLVIAALAVSLPVLLSESVGTLNDSPGIVKLTRDPGEFVAFFLLIAVCSQLLGYFFTFLPVAALSQFMLAATFFVCSLRSRYRHTALSASRWVDGAIGPNGAGEGVLFPATAPQAAVLSRVTGSLRRTRVSLLPVHPSRWTDTWTAGLTLGFLPSAAIIRSTFWIGCSYLLTVGWVLWPITSPTAAALWSAATVAVTTLGAFRIRRAVRATTSHWAPTSAPHA